MFLLILTLYFPFHSVSHGVCDLTTWLVSLGLLSLLFKGQPSFSFKMERGGERPLWSGEECGICDWCLFPVPQGIMSAASSTSRDRSSYRSGRPINDHLSLWLQKSLIIELPGSHWSFNDDFNLHTSQMVSRTLLWMEVVRHVQAGCFKVNCTLILFIWKVTLSFWQLHFMNPLPGLGKWILAKHLYFQ